MNPQQILNMMMSNPSVRNNPMANNAMQLFQSGNTKDLRTLAENLAKQKGVNIDDIKRQIGM